MAERKTLRDDLVAAKALIADEAKWDALRETTGSAIAATFYEVAGIDERRVTAMFLAVMEVWTPQPSHAEFLAILDAAISAAEGN